MIIDITIIGLLKGLVIFLAAIIAYVIGIIVGYCTCVDQFYQRYKYIYGVKKK